MWRKGTRNLVTRHINLLKHWRRKEVFNSIYQNNKPQRCQLLKQNAWEFLLILERWQLGYISVWKVWSGHIYTPPLNNFLALFRPACLFWTWEHHRDILTFCNLTHTFIHIWHVFPRSSTDFFQHDRWGIKKIHVCFSIRLM